MKKPFLANYEENTNDYTFNNEDKFQGRTITESVEDTDCDITPLIEKGRTLTRTLEDSDFDNSLV